MLFSFANTLYYYKNACIKMLLIWCKGKVIPSHGESSVSLTHPQFPHLFIYLLIWSFHICIWIYQSCYLKQHFHKNCFCHFFADTFFLSTKCHLLYSTLTLFYMDIRYLMLNLNWSCDWRSLGLVWKVVPDWVWGGVWGVVHSVPGGGWLFWRVVVSGRRFWSFLIHAVYKAVKLQSRLVLNICNGIVGQSL